MDLHGATALVTGAARRVGRAVALGLAAAGCNLVVHHRSSVDEAEGTATEARDLGVDAVVVGADLAHDPGSVFDAVGSLAPVRVLVNSAAVFPEDTLLDVERSGWDATIAANLAAPVLLTQAFARQAWETGGVVVNLTDWRTDRPYRNHFSYTVSKGALDTFTLAAAEALAPRIRVNGIALGAMLPPPGKDAEHLSDLAAGIPLRRAGGVEPVVDTVLFLVRNDFITGEIVRVDGGAHLT
jgi:NAD(P)-dependent dehydrogenase (short-subunit alcohol dehydrogenase family)